MDPKYIEKAIQEIEALENIPRKEQTNYGNSILYRLLLIIYDEMGIQTENQRHIIDALYDIVGAIRKEY